MNISTVSVPHLVLNLLQVEFVVAWSHPFAVTSDWSSGLFCWRKSAEYADFKGNFHDYQNQGRARCDACSLGCASCSGAPATHHAQTSHSGATYGSAYLYGRSDQWPQGPSYAATTIPKLCSLPALAERSR